MDATMILISGQIDCIADRYVVAKAARTFILIGNFLPKFNIVKINFVADGLFFRRVSSRLVIKSLQ